MDYENIRQELINIVRKYKRFARSDLEDIIQEGFIFYLESSGDLELVEKKVREFCNRDRNKVCTFRFPDFDFQSKKEINENTLNEKDFSDIENLLELVKEISPILEELLRSRYGIKTDVLTWNQLSNKLDLSPLRLRFLFYRSLRVLRKVSTDFKYKSKFGPEGIRRENVFRRIVTIQGELLQYLFLKDKPLSLCDIARDFYPRNDTSIRYYLEDMLFKKYIFSGHLYFERNLRIHNGFIRRCKFLNKVYSINPVQSDVEKKYG